MNENAENVEKYAFSVDFFAKPSSKNIKLVHVLCQYPTIGYPQSVMIDRSKLLFIKVVKNILLCPWLVN
jgi:hypothetical protein